MLISPKLALKTRRKQRQRGLSLIESLISLLVLGLGIMGLAGVQTRLLVESRTANQRAVAIGLIDDLTNKILLNRDAANAGNYALAWGGNSAAINCITAQCTGAQLAQSDLFLWRAQMNTALPGSSATVFQSATDGRQIGISIAWAANESSADATYNNPFTGTTALSGTALSGVVCPINSICHSVYVQP